MNLIKNKTILISALDWGFGHTTRCVSVIKTLMLNNNKIIFAGNTHQTNFIQNEFPQLKIENIDGYDIKLSSKKSTYLQLFLQTNKIKKAIKKECNWVNNYVKQNAVDFIISDNRYGFRHNKVESIFMGHQINIKAPFLKKAANKKLLCYINKFNKVWIVDDKNKNLAGDLSNPKRLTIPYEYIGLLSRFTFEKLNEVYHYLVIVSGASPENSDFLSEIENQFKKNNKKIAIVSTVKSKNELIHIKYFYSPPSFLLNQLINQSNTIISKAGYTTLMELQVLNKKAILIPTKGQYEQLYLSKVNKDNNFVFKNSLNKIEWEL